MNQVDFHRKTIIIVRDVNVETSLINSKYTGAISIIYFACFQDNYIMSPIPSCLQRTDENATPPSGNMTVSCDLMTGYQ